LGEKGKDSADISKVEPFGIANATEYDWAAAGVLESGGESLGGIL
jgi:hypothetical protein